MSAACIVSHLASFTSGRVTALSQRFLAMSEQSYNESMLIQLQRIGRANAVYLCYHILFYSSIK